MQKDTKKGIFQGIIEKDENGNYFCGPYLLDYKQVESEFKLGDKISIKTVIANPSDKSYETYPKKSMKFFLVRDEDREMFS
ncbi:MULTISPECIES: hypothetical protein [unclassified Flavobacterium]|uniref:hypothetical protein n=1 Tax=unclassified Flavobacterium TaxID=196869 RepID=UPI001C5B45DA|nr:MULTISPECIES: hypothetical protein [unclassified Flavobacterium]MBW3518289.1 hypothetical protein [Flavobacterium sp. NKUCC04_CG]MCP1995492.1 hypothetical protein [Flavobacterium sp. HSC-61S13]